MDYDYNSCHLKVIFNWSGNGSTFPTLKIKIKKESKYKCYIVLENVLFWD